MFTKYRHKYFIKLLNDKTRSIYYNICVLMKNPRKINNNKNIYQQKIHLLNLLFQHVRRNSNNVIINFQNIFRQCNCVIPSDDNMPCVRFRGMKNISVVENFELTRSISVFFFYKLLIFIILYIICARVVFTAVEIVNYG